MSSQLEAWLLVATCAVFGSACGEASETKTDKPSAEAAALMTELVQARKDGDVEACERLGDRAAALYDETRMRDYDLAVDFAVSCLKKYHACEAAYSFGTMTSIDLSACKASRD